MMKNAIKKKGLAVTLSLALLASLVPAAYANDTVKLIINGKAVQSDVPPVVINDRTMVPIRVIAEQLGAKVEWSDEKQAVLINSKAEQAAPKGDQIQLIVNGKAVKSDVAPINKDGRILVPVRFVAEAMNVKVGWDNATRTVSVGSNEPAVTAVKRGSANFKLAAEHTIDWTKSSVNERYAKSNKVSVLDMLEYVEFDQGIKRDGATFENTLTEPGGKSNRYIRIGIKDGKGIFDLTALNGHSGEAGVHINANIDVSKTTNGMYVDVKNKVDAEKGFLSPRQFINYKDYVNQGSVNSVVELPVNLWDINDAFIEVLLPYQAQITINDIYMYLQTEVLGFSDMHKRITGGAAAAPENIYLANDGGEFATALDEVKATGKPSIIYVGGELNFAVNLGADVKNLSIIGVGDKAVLEGAGITINGHNIIIENLTIQNVKAKDGIEINNGTDIWVRHNTFIDGGRELPEGERFDEFMSVKNSSQGVIISWNHFKNGNRVLLVGSNDEIDARPDRKIIMHHNFIENVTQRVPLYRGGHGHIYNNYIKNVNLSASNVRSNAKLRIENNYYEDVRDPIGDFHGLIPGRFEVRGNIFKNSTGRQPTESMITVNFKDYKYELDRTEEVPEIVTKGAGAGKIKQDLPF